MRFANLFICTMLLASSLVASASGSEKAPPENGVWVGVIGGSEVMACFMRDNTPDHANQSAYFYLRHSKSISLIPHPAKSNVWFEGSVMNPSGIWMIKVQGDRMTGDWSNAAKTKALPISLTRVQSILSDNASSCRAGSGIFDPVVYPQVLSEKVASGDEKTINGRRYRVLSALDGAVQSVELLEVGEPIAALNILLENELRANISAYYGCSPNDERYPGKKGRHEKSDYYFSIEPLFWVGRWISFVARTSGYCGGAYPFSERSYSTWNLSAGREVNLWEWIGNSKKIDGSSKYDRYYFNYSAPEELNEIIIKKAINQRLAFNLEEATEENNCLDVIRGNSEYEIRLSATGFIFTQVFPHVVQACTDDLEITYGELMPFLTKKGREAVIGIRRNQ